MLTAPTMAFNYDWTTDHTFPTTSTNQPAEFSFDLEVSDWGQFNFEPLVPCATDGGHNLLPFSPLEPPADFYSLLLSPPGTSEPASSPTLPSPPTPDSILAWPSSAQLPAPIQPTPRPLTPPTQTQELAPSKIKNFDLCPWTRHGQLCGYVSWGCSGHKQIKRHLKAEHFPDTSLGFKCPNPKCKHKNYRFLRNDAYKLHRKGCDLVQVPGYVPLPDVVSGSDEEVERWMKARWKPRKKIIKQLMNGASWSEDLLKLASI